VGRDAAEKGKNTPRDRWRRATFLAARLQDGDEMLSKGKSAYPEAARKHLETQHWLELIDGKHRYGSNCLNYLVTTDSTGKLRWAHNGELVDTTAGRWKDAGGGRGIVPFDEAHRTPEPRHSFSAPSPSSNSGASASSSLSGDADSQMMHYVGLRRQPKNPIKRVLWKNFTLRGLVDKLLRKTIKRNTWIYVSVSISDIDSTREMLMSRRTRTVRACASSHFKRFTSVLEERGVDMSKVEYSKAELALWGYVASTVLRMTDCIDAFRTAASSTLVNSRRNKVQSLRAPKTRLRPRWTKSPVVFMGGNQAKTMTSLSRAPRSGITPKTIMKRHLRRCTAV
ncbi:hypothetical protein C2E23DRAFT_947239, partial [Lenzites betulinus]